VTGAAEIATAFRLRREVPNERLLVIAGVLSILFGAALALFPDAGAPAVAWLIGLYAIIFGMALIGLGLRLRQLHSTPVTSAITANQPKPPS
jgi:uncharacterized membrane protein HdeD (DUF308 family)